MTVFWTLNCDIFWMEKSYEDNRPSTCYATSLIYQGGGGQNWLFFDVVVCFSMPSFVSRCCRSFYDAVIRISMLSSVSCRRLLLDAVVRFSMSSFVPRCRRLSGDVVGRSLLLSNLVREIIPKIRKCVYKWQP